jgi:hypothetical protein
MKHGFTIFLNKTLGYKHTLNVQRDDVETWIEYRRSLPEQPGIRGMRMVVFVVGCIDYGLIFNERRQSGFVFHMDCAKGGIEPLEEVPRDQLRVRPWVLWTDTSTN